MDKVEKDFRVDLSNLTKIPVDEFERHFRDWMERDDVARGLQAKLRTDLIANFNKTTLGKQILSQTTTTTTGGSTQRLTLSPLTLALNTLVAEFLYAQNCHFTLSVFCTEVPFRNTLPDFESFSFFRFTESEIAEIFDAITGGSVKWVNPLKHQITQYYAANNNVSLLLLVLKALLDKPIEAVANPEPAKSQPQPKENGGIKTDEEKASERNDMKAEAYNTSFRYLNKYLIILSKKVKEMAQQFESLQQQQRQQHQVSVTAAKLLPRPRSTKSVRTRKYENLNRSLERITQHLKQMTHAKRRSKHVAAIVNAIDALARQFTRCATNFENVSKDFGGTASKSKEQIQQTMEKGQQPVNARASFTEKQTETGVREKSYTDWVHEMRHTRNGHKFLDRIEISLRKALSKQKDLLYNETEMKLRHQKELLKIRYKQQLMEHLSKHGTGDVCGETRKLNENIAQHLKEFEAKHFDLLNKIRSSDAAIAKQQPPKEVIVEKFLERIQEREPEKCRDTDSSVLASVKSRTPVLKDAINTQKQLQKMVKSIAEQGRTVDHIVYDAKLRIKELENESNQLDHNFQAYLERQKLQKEVEKKASVKLCHNNAVQDSHKMVVRENQQRKQQQLLEERRRSEDDYSALNESTRRSDAHNHVRGGVVEVKSITSGEQSSRPFEFKNPILEAKEKFFADGQRFHDQKGRAFEMPELHLYGIVSKTETEYDVCVDESVEPYFYNRNFGNKQSLMNFTTAHESSTSGGNLTLHSPLEQMHNKQKQQLAPPQQIFLSNNNTRNLSTSSESSNESSLGATAATSQQQSQMHRGKAIRRIRRQLFDVDTTSTTTLYRNNDIEHAHANKNGVSVAEVQVQRDRLNNNRKDNNRNGSSNKETLMVQLQQSLVATTDRASNDENFIATTTTAIQSTSLVLQQSMEKMQQLFEQTQAQTQKNSNEGGNNSKHTTTTTQKQEQQTFASTYDALKCKHVNKNVADDDDDDDVKSEIVGMSMSNNIQHDMHTIESQQQEKHQQLNDTNAGIENIALANGERKQSLSQNYDKQFRLELQHEIDDNGSNSKIMQSLNKPKTTQNIAPNSKFILHTHTTTAATQAQTTTATTTAAAFIDSNQSESSVDVEKVKAAITTGNATQGKDDESDAEDEIEDDGADLVEIGEIVDRVNVNSAAIANVTTVRFVELQTDVASTSSCNSSSSSSIVLQLSTGRGRGGEGDGRQSDDSGSDFWQ